ncbi:hypothetical protein BJ170DRAFT_225561 [Xylariales sp. AK1849]|nr:hypothetical protein BJ170DRAFT_225561 [Xylariales sp. AK1849]
MTMLKVIAIVSVLVISGGITVKAAVGAESTRTASTASTASTTSTLTAPWDDPTHTPSTFTTIHLTYTSSSVSSHPTSIAPTVTSDDGIVVIKTASHSYHAVTSELARPQTTESVYHRNGTIMSHQTRLNQTVHWCNPPRTTQAGSAATRSAAIEPIGDLTIAHQAGYTATPYGCIATPGATPGSRADVGVNQQLAVDRNVYGQIMQEGKTLTAAWTTFETLTVTLTLASPNVSPVLSTYTGKVNVVSETVVYETPTAGGAAPSAEAVTSSFSITTQPGLPSRVNPSATWDSCYLNCSSTGNASGISTISSSMNKTMTASATATETKNTQPSTTSSTAGVAPTSARRR